LAAAIDTDAESLSVRALRDCFIWIALAATATETLSHPVHRHKQLSYIIRFDSVTL